MALPEDRKSENRALAQPPSSLRDLDLPGQSIGLTKSRPNGAGPGWLSGYRGLLIGLGTGMILMLGVGQWMGRSGSNSGSIPAPTPVPAPSAAQTVAASTVQMAPIQTTLMVSGTVQAVDLLDITPQISGLQIQQILVREGDQVVAGQPLAILDDSTLRADWQRQEAQIAVAQAQVKQQQAALSQAQALLAEAQQNLTRYRSLADQGAISQEELTGRQTQAVTAQEAVAVARANVESAEANERSQRADRDRLQTQLNQTVVRAPAAGLVAERRATVGDVSSTVTPVISLIQNNQIELEAEVPQAQLSQVQVGSAVTLTSSSDSRIQLQGSVQSIHPLIAPDSRTAVVKIRLPGSDLLRPGMFLQGEVVTGTRQGLVVPTGAVVPQADSTVRVYVLGPDRQVAARSVVLGTRLPATATRGAQVEILQGLQVGESIVTTGVSYLQDGDVVTVVEN